VSGSRRGRTFGEARGPGLALLLLAAIIFRAAIPAGWMPNAQDRGLVICTGHGELVLHGKAGPAAPHSADRHDVCAFAGLGSAPTPEAPVMEAPLAFARAGVERPARAAFIAVCPRHREQAARAPPRLV
jgi:hypothetical protein